ncbi:MAG TPA: N-acetylmuramoyl-L-alanine amidase [Longimicrobium sp.]|jgi:N-acetyl-anhydromuramyl-L-alanine amidase AmpD
MKATQIPAHEKAFRTTGNAGGRPYVLTPAEVEIPGTTETFEVVACTRKDGVDSYFFKQEQVKKRIVVHYTEGFLQGDIATLSSKDLHVSVPFVVARDGTIYRLFSSKQWSFHLGKGAAGGNEPMSKSSVAIELSNVGHLVQDGNNLREPSGTVYCSLDEKQFYKKLAQPYRGFSFYATFTDEQYQSLITLLRYLSATFDIPKQFIDEPRRFETIDNIAAFAGITTHVNYRKTGKRDIGPAFDWARVIAGVSTIPVTGIVTPGGAPVG